MIVEKLINELNKFPKDREVCYYGTKWEEDDESSEGLFPVVSVNEITKALNKNYIGKIQLDINESIFQTKVVPMNIGMLIDELQKFPKDREVCYYGEKPVGFEDTIYGLFPIKAVKEVNDTFNKDNIGKINLIHE